MTMFQTATPPPTVDQLQRKALDHLAQTHSWYAIGDSDAQHVELFSQRIDAARDKFRRTEACRAVGTLRKRLVAANDRANAARAAMDQADAQLREALRKVNDAAADAAKQRHRAADTDLAEAVKEATMLSELVHEAETEAAHKWRVMVDEVADTIAREAAAELDEAFATLVARLNAADFVSLLERHHRAVRLVATKEREQMHSHFRNGIKADFGIKYATFGELLAAVGAETVPDPTT